MTSADRVVPLLGDINNNDDGDDVVSCRMSQSPVPGLKHRWRKIKVKDKENFLKDPRWNALIGSFLDDLNSRPCCTDVFNPQCVGPCTCLSGTFADETSDSVIKEAFKFALLPFEATQLLVLSWM